MASEGHFEITIPLDMHRIDMEILLERHFGIITRFYSILVFEREKSNGPQANYKVSTST
jgi:hypothetical protein